MSHSTFDRKMWTYRFCGVDEGRAKRMRIKVEARTNHDNIKDEKNNIQNEEDSSKGV